MSATSVLAVILVTVWVVTGVGTGIWMARRGHDAWWTFVAVVLGPLFVPIAWERVERHSRLAVAGPEGPPPPRSPGDVGLRVLVGLDGSGESERALDSAIRLLGPQCSAFVLAEVVCFDTAEDDREAVEAARTRLATAATRAAGIPATYEVLAGPAAEALRQFADAQDMDLLVVGRRGHGLSNRLLGSVSADLVRHAGIPVLVGGPGHPRPARPDAGDHLAAAVR